jgi:ABC-type nitrate/sulfonate/bicarbonate transport system substrate-binding protein
MAMSTKYIFAISIVALFAFFSEAGSQDRLTKFRFVHLEANGSQAVPFIAKEARVFEKNGLDVEIIRIGGGSRAIQAMLAGEIKVAHGSSPAVVEANLAGADLVIIASTVNVATFRMMVAPTIKIPGALKGKKIGISRFGGQTDTLTRHLLDRWRIDAKDVALLQTGGGAETAAAMITKAIDGALVNPPLHLNLADAGFRTMANLGEMGVPYTSGSVVTTRSYVRTNPDMLRGRCWKESRSTRPIVTSRSRRWKNIPATEIRKCCQLCGRSSVTASFKEFRTRTRLALSSFWTRLRCEGPKRRK